MTESVNVGREGRYTIGLIDEDRIKYIKAMNTERDTYNQIEYTRESGREEGRKEGLKVGQKDTRKDMKKAKRKVSRKVVLRA